MFSRRYRRQFLIALVVAVFVAVLVEAARWHLPARPLPSPKLLRPGWGK
jgi:hypothetical protein